MPGNKKSPGLKSGQIQLLAPKGANTNTEFLLEGVTAVQQDAPSGEEVAVAMPVGFGEGVIATLVLEDGLAAELLHATPAAVEQVGEVVDIGTELEGGLTSTYVEVELLVDAEVDAVGPGAEGTVADTVFATMCAEVGIAVDEGLKGGAVGLVGKGHASQFILGGDV